MTTRLLSASILLSTASAQCSDQTKQEGPCKVKYHVCGEIDKFEWKYTCDATDTKSGIKVHAGAHSSSTGAADAATLQLYQAMIVTPSLSTSNATDPCNCATDVETINAKCVLQITTCFYFLNTNDLNAAHPAFRAWAFDMQSNATGYNDNAAGYNATNAVKAALQDLATKESLAKCAAPEEKKEEGVSEDLLSRVTDRLSIRRS